MSLGALPESLFDHIRRQQLLREAEGYVELISCLSDRWSLAPDIRDRLAQRALDALDKMNGAAEFRSHVLYLKGQSLLAVERFGDAIEPLRAAADLNKEDVAARLALAWCYKRNGRLDFAIQALEEALEIEPDKGIVHYNLACYWSLANKPQLSVHYLATALEIDSDFRDKLADEPDFDAIREHPDFLSLTSVIV